MAAQLNHMPTLFIPHGGGPCFFMEPHDQWDNLAAYLRGIDKSLGVRPKAVLVISGHWEEAPPTVNAGAAPPLFFDYYGFPEHTYRLQYPAPGSAHLAGRVQEVMASAGFKSDTDSQRGLDHGVFVPFLLIYPDADVPIVQLSLHANLDGETHLALGRALKPLREEGVLIVGSGMSYHNLREFSFDNPRSNDASVRFDDWLNQAVTDADSDKRNHALAGWETAPDALRCNPRPEHLLPLMVAAGAAGGDVGRRVFSDRIRGKMISGFQFG